jgi:hypothetical protein
VGFEISVEKLRLNLVVYLYVSAWFLQQIREKIVKVGELNFREEKCLWEIVTDVSSLGSFCIA